jgi:8-oxo-dGTP pyrophosphatase MutT (NUDIX family)
VTGTEIRLPDEFARRARDILAGSKEPAVPRDASTVALLRPDPGGGFDVYLLRRTRSMAFAPGAHVFPGGSVDPRDADAELAWAGPDPAEWGQILHCSGAVARALICAAVRETFEESGVLLAGPAADAVVPDTTGDDWEADRHALIDRSLSLAGLLQRRGLALRCDLLSPWARWITPEIESRRFDTRFFAAALPTGQRTRDVGGEADEVAWLAPTLAIDAARRGEILLMPPTAVTLAELAGYDSAAQALAASRDMAPRQPRVSVTGDAAWLTIPDGLEYPL